EAAYLALIPENFHEGLQRLFKDLARERQQEQKKLAAELKSPEYRSKISLFESHLALCPKTPTKKGHKPVLKIAARQIISRYNAIAMDALEITDTSPDEQVHEVRLGCKKLRYLLEFFADLFPKKQIRPLIKALKKLQDNLGAFNDLSVQRERLEQYLQHNKVAPDTQAAVHALNGVLFNRQRVERSYIRAQLANFLDDNVRQSVESLIPKAITTETKTGRLSE
ncbi:CHAD domain-containing protein, partial [Oceanospirillum sp. HFRX-1_2]